MTKLFLTNLPINEVKTAAGIKHCHLTYLIGLPNTGTDEQGTLLVKGWLLNEDQQKPNQLELGQLQSQDLDPISLLADAFIQEHVTFTNTVVISWILTHFLKWPLSHFSIYHNQFLIHSPRLAVCGTIDSVIFILRKFSGETLHVVQVWWWRFTTSIHFFH